jgi:hypothetical protein
MVEFQNVKRDLYHSQNKELTHSKNYLTLIIKSGQQPLLLSGQKILASLSKKKTYIFAFSFSSVFH